MENNIMNNEPNTPIENNVNTKFCMHCGEKIAEKAVICPKCGCQVEDIGSKSEQPSVVINNTNTNTNVNRNINTAGMGNPRNKWVAFCLCFFLGWLGAHKFYEGKAVMGILYLFTFGLFFFGIIIDLIVILGKPNPYYVYK